MYRGAGFVWVGLTDKQHEMSYKRYDGLYPEWARWALDEPSLGPGMDCAFWFKGVSRMYATTCTDYSLAYMCEVYIGHCFE